MRYDSEEGGSFHAHRDTIVPDTVRRRFAINLSLNCKDYEGDDLRFPKYGITVTVH